MSTLRDILTGWGNLIIPPKALLPKFRTRFKICNSCSVRKGIICSKDKGGCGCVIIAKTRSRSKCPLDKW